MANDENRTIEDDGTIVIKKAGLYEISFVKEPLHPSWRIELVEKQNPYLLTEFVAKEGAEWEDLYDITNWKKSNYEFLQKLLVRPYNRSSTAGDPFRRHSVAEVQRALHELLDSIFPTPEDHKREYEGHWNGEW